MNDDSKLRWSVENTGPNPAFIKVYDRGTGTHIWTQIVPVNGGVVMGWDPFGRKPVVVVVSDDLRDEVPND